jgi:LytS/YehU family sensor histidine kinase
LGRELELIDAYLNVQQVRMGERLKVEKSIAEEHLVASLPPMILLTLVENAIKHGLGPLPNGGTLRIRAEGNGVRLRLVVEDNGAGFHQPSGSGVGLANTRDRLATLYGDESRLLFEGNADGGITVTIELPYRVPQAERVPS